MRLNALLNAEGTRALVAKTQFFGANVRKKPVIGLMGQTEELVLKKLLDGMPCHSLIAVLQISLTQLDRVYFAKATQRY
jgi:hypothetical protein